MACLPLLSEIESHNLTPCVIVALHCKNCEEVQLGLDYAPTSKFHPCPICNAACRYSILGTGVDTAKSPVLGQTARHLPI